MMADQVVDDEVKAQLAQMMAGDANVDKALAANPLPQAPAQAAPSVAPQQQRPQSVAAVTNSPAPAVNPSNPDPAAPAPAKSRGFDWARAAWAAAGNDLGSFDKHRADLKAAPGREADARLERQLKTSQFEDLQKQRQLARDGMDPASTVSREAQQRFATKMRTMANLPGTASAIREQLQAAADGAQGRNAADITRLDASLSDLYGTGMKAADTFSRQELAKQGAGLNERKTAAAELQAENTGKNMQVDNWRDNRRLDEDVRHHQAMEGVADKNASKMELKVQKTAQEKLNQEISDLHVASNNMEELLSTKEKVNTGPIAGRVQGALSKVDLASDDYVKLRSLGARVFNKETKSLAGTAVSAKEWERIAPQIPDDNDDDRTYKIKMENALKVTREILAERKKQYQVMGGAPIDKSVTARENNPESPQAPKAAKPPQPPAGTQPGLVRRNKTTGAQWKWDGTDWQAL